MAGIPVVDCRPGVHGAGLLRHNKPRWAGESEARGVGRGARGGASDKGKANGTERMQGTDVLRRALGSALQAARQFGGVILGLRSPGSLRPRLSYGGLSARLDGGTRRGARGAGPLGGRRLG